MASTPSWTAIYRPIYITALDIVNNNNKSYTAHEKSVKQLTDYFLPTVSDKRNAEAMKGKKAIKSIIRDI